MKELDSDVTLATFQFERSRLKVEAPANAESNEVTLETSHREMASHLLVPFRTSSILS